MEEEFALAIEIAIQQLLNKPFGYAIRYRNVRIAHPKRFPYNIHFYIDEANLTVVITAIVHIKRDPRRFFNRKR
ncbi:plasmid stabilization system [Cecembia calidifontis]|uniref:plasmid stabilization system n=1 Tax=Cecembia calidifontis TaxID=1187080 RepID=UPI00102886FD|nr:plasmid stabilization system [Cecembia calidifontis]